MTTTSDWSSLKVGDHIAMHYVDQVHVGTPVSDLPVVAGVILALPDGGTNVYYEIKLDPLPAEIFANPDVYIGDEGEELPYLAHARDLVGLLPRTLHRADVEEWLAQDA